MEFKLNRTSLVAHSKTISLKSDDEVKFLKVLPEIDNPIAILSLRLKLNPITTIAAVYPAAPPQPTR